MRKLNAVVKITKKRARTAKNGKMSKKIEKMLMQGKLPKFFLKAEN